MTDYHLERVIGTALDDVGVSVPAHTRAELVDRVAELLELDREQRIQARRDRTCEAFRQSEGR